jgi:hypothetical protein
MLGKKPQIRLIDTTVIVYNKPCKIVRVQWSSGYYDYYFNTGFLPMNPELYKNHIYDGWSDFLKISQSLPVQIVKSVNGMMTTTLTLVEAQPKAIELAMFALPKLVAGKDSKTPLVPNRVIMKIKK